MAQSSRRPKNVLLITADQFRADCLHGSFVQTPNLDRLAREGIRFDQHYCQATPCAPSRAALHTGCYLMNTHVPDNGSPLTEALTNWAQEARERAGYDPVLLGYVDQVPDTSTHAASDSKLGHWEGGYLPGLRRLTETDFMGSTEWLKERGIHWAPSGAGLADQGWNGYFGDQTWLAMRREDARCAPYPAPSVFNFEDSDTRILVNKAMDFIETKQAGVAAAEAEPGWMMHLSILKPHPPWTPPHPYNLMYDPSDIERECPLIRAESAEDEAGGHPWLLGIAHRDIVGSQQKKHYLTRSRYYALVSEVDDNLGRLLTLMRTCGAYDDTLIVFTSDHGEQLGDHWLYGKLGFYEASYHIPLIVRDPSPEAASHRGRAVREVFTENVDIVPTMLDWLGLQVPLQCDGLSLLPFLRGAAVPPEGWRTAAHWEFHYSSWGQPIVPSGSFIGKELGLKSPEECQICVLRTQRFKLVHFQGGLPPLLFDLAGDPSELHNIATDPSYQAVLLQLMQEMLEWRIAHNGAAARGLLRTKVNCQNVLVSRL